MRFTSFALASTIVAAAAPAYADGALDEVSAGSQPQTATTPKSTWLADKVAAMWDPGERWQLRVDFTATRDFGVRPVAMPTANDTTDIFLVNAAAEYNPDDQVSIKLVGGYSPQSTMFSGTTVPFTTRTGMNVDANAALQATSGSYSGGVLFGFDSGTTRDVEASLTLLVNATEYDTRQQIVALQDRAGGNLDVQQLRDYCAATKCPAQLAAALAGGDAQLAQVALEATAALTLERNTDIGIDATYYAYDRDPTQVGYFSLAAVGRASSLGGGIGIAPYSYTVAPDVVVRIGGLMSMASVSYGKYVDDEGWDVTGSLRVQYKLKLAHGKRVKLWGRVLASRDVDQTKAVSTSGSAALGVQYTW
jgi:hypothetical protein